MMDEAQFVWFTLFRFTFEFQCCTNIVFYANNDSRERFIATQSRQISSRLYAMEFQVFSNKLTWKLFSITYTHSVYITQLRHWLWFATFKHMLVIPFLPKLFTCKSQQMDKSRQKNGKWHRHTQKTHSQRHTCVYICIQNWLERHMKMK